LLTGYHSQLVRGADRVGANAMTNSSEIDVLFRLPLAEFTAARNALASSLKKQKRPVEAEEVKSLPKPPATAWAVNQLFWAQSQEFEQLFELGEKVRSSSGTPAALRTLLDARRTLISELTRRAAAVLRESGHAVSLDATRRITVTLETLSSTGRTDAISRAGRLTSDLEPLGFEDLAAMFVPREPPQQGRVLPFGHEAREKKAAEIRAAEAARAERRAAEKKAAEQKAAEAAAAAMERAKQEVKAAEGALKTARMRARATEAALAKAKQHTTRIEAQKRELEKRLEEALEAQQQVADEASSSAQALVDAEEALARARARLAGE
jgi:DNA repair exonuclease SbcCD ATPase subunit